MTRGKRQKRWVGLLVCSGALALAEAAGASRGDEEVRREADREVIEKRTRLDFSDAWIDGDLVRPEEGYVPGSGRIRFDNLIQLRKDFVQELETSTKNL